MALTNSLLFLSTLIICSFAFSSATSSSKGNVSRLVAASPQNAPLEKILKVVQYFDPTNLFDLQVSFRSYNFPNHLIRHSDFNVWSEDHKGGSYAKDATFTIRRALNGNQRAVSLESVNLPGHFIRHQGGNLFVHKGSGDLFNNDASFQIAFSRIGGLFGDLNYVSLESANFPGHFIRHLHGRCRISKDDGSDLFEKDAAWQISTPLYE